MNFGIDVNLRQCKLQIDSTEFYGAAKVCAAEKSTIGSEKAKNGNSVIILLLGYPLTVFALNH